jgi:alkylation response protein AidB-like acyl-CoA dehydrogenase
MGTGRIPRFARAAKSAPPRVGKKQRQLTAVAHAALVTSGIYNLARPRAPGGEQADLLTMVRAVRSLSRFDGSAGWCGMISGYRAADPV